jgi:FkbM family methyltransferase
MRKTPLDRLLAFTRCALRLGASPGQRARILWHLSKNLRVRAGLARHHPDRIYALPTRYGTVHLRDNLGDITNLPGLWADNEYGIGRLAEPGAILDAGANIGLFAAWAAAHNPDRPIYCFEPLAPNRALIPRNCPGAVIVPCGLGRERREVLLRVDPHATMASSIPNPWATREERFDVVPLDAWAAETGLGAVAFLKVDTEGMELEVLDGAREVLARTCHVALETHGADRHRGALERLAAAGFTVSAAPFDGLTGHVRATRGAAR